MRIGEFMEKAGVSLRTARYLHDMWHPNFEEEHRTFTEDEVKWVLARKPENVRFQLRQVSDFPAYYVAPNGDVFVYKRGFLELLQGEVKQGYRYVCFNDGVKSLCMKVSRLVALLYIPNPQNKPVINHKDGNKLNDTVENLEWVTVSENTKHAYDMGLAKNAAGFDDSQSYPVYHVNLNKQVLGVYGSISEAARQLGERKNKISRAAKANTPRLLSDQPLQSRSNATFVYYTKETQQKVIK